MVVKRHYKGVNRLFLTCTEGHARPTVLANHAAQDGAEGEAKAIEGRHEPEYLLGGGTRDRCR